jgi:hypothetical protein
MQDSHGRCYHMRGRSIDMIDAKSPRRTMQVEAWRINWLNRGNKLSGCLRDGACRLLGHSLPSNSPFQRFARAYVQMYDERTSEWML